MCKQNNEWIPAEKSQISFSGSEESCTISTIQQKYSVTWTNKFASMGVASLYLLSLKKKCACPWAGFLLTLNIIFLSLIIICFESVFC